MMSKDLVGFEELDGSGCRVGIVKTRWNPEIMSNLYDGVKTALKDCGVKDANIYDTTVPGSFELPLAARFLAMSRQCDVVITLGCLIKGETMHFEYIAEAVSKGLMDVSRVHSVSSVLTDGTLQFLPVNLTSSPEARRLTLYHDNSCNRSSCRRRSP